MSKTVKIKLYPTTLPHSLEFDVDDNASNEAIILLVQNKIIENLQYSTEIIDSNQGELKV